jgi:outer membrane protein
MMVRSLKQTAWAMAIVPVVALSAAAQDARPIALDEAVRAAQQNAPSAVQARNALRTGEQAIRSSIAAFLPNLSLSYSGGQQGGTQFVQGTPVAFTGLPWSYNRALSTNMNLFDGGQRWYQYKASEANLDASGANEVAQRYAVALTVKQQYFAVLAARESEAAAKRQYDQATQQLKISVAKLQAGTATRADSLTSAFALGNARLSILNAQNAIRNANAALTRLVASPVTVTALPSDTLGTPRIALSDDELAKLVADGPTVRQTSAQVTAARATQRAQTTPYFPQISVSGSYGQNPKGSQNWNWGGGPTSTSTSMRFTMSYTLWNNYTREQQLVTARVNADNAEANFRDARMLAQQNLTTFLSNFRTAEETIALQNLQIQSAEEALRVVQQRYNLGSANLLEVLQAQTNLDNARVQLINARVNARTAKANIEALVGRDLP